MGIRVNKKIGYFLSANDINTIFEHDPYDLEELLDYDTEYTEKLFKKVKLASSLFTKKLDKRFMHYDISLSTIKNTYNRIYDCDSLHGILFQTPAEYDVNRYDDLIDFYENQADTNFSAQYLNHAIYPLRAYVYNEGMIHHELKDVMITPDNRIAIWSGCKRGDIINNQDIILSNESLVMSNFIFPACEGSIWIFMLNTGFMKKTIDYVEFCRNVKPAIITYWS